MFAGRTVTQVASVALCVCMCVCVRWVLVTTVFLGDLKALPQQPKSQENPRQSEWLAFLRVVTKYFIKSIYFYFNVSDMHV